MTLIRVLGKKWKSVTKGRGYKKCHLAIEVLFECDQSYVSLRLVFYQGDIGFQVINTNKELNLYDVCVM